MDPGTKTIAVYRLAEDAQTPVATFGGQAVFESRLLPGLRVEAARVFKASPRR